jgi:hypothetical protein
MATSGELIGGFAEVLKISEAEVGFYYRNLREAGLMTRGGRGRSAPPMTSLDLARLLIAFLVTNVARKAPEAVNDFGQLSLQNALVPDKEASPFWIPNFTYLGRGHRFEAAIAELINKAASEELTGILSNNKTEHLSHFLIHVAENKIIASINIGNIENVYYLPETRHNNRMEKFNYLHDKYECGIKTFREIGFLHFYNLALLLKN